MKRFLLPALLLLAAVGPARADMIPPAAGFFFNLSALCGKSFEGRVVTTDPADAAFAGKRLVMRVTDCTASGLRIPFSVGEDRSRTWVVTRVGATGIRLKHDHRHEDGSEDVLSQYGGEAQSLGTFNRQEFPADAFSKALFLEKGNPASVDNVWALEVAGTIFAYELRRPGRHFRVEFDVTRPLP
jgi:hypothetical protein